MSVPTYEPMSQESAQQNQQSFYRRFKKLTNQTPERDTIDTHLTKFENHK